MTVELQVLDKGSTSAAHPAPLLFVHGAWHAAWCWQNFLNFFADKGYRALAVSLRGHGYSPSPKRFRFCTLSDYLDDVESVAAGLSVPPILVGHSMGGLIVQKYLQRKHAPAAVLVASVPVNGSRAFTLRLLRRHPWLVLRNSVTGDGGYGINTPAVARRLFYSTDTAESDVVRYAALVGNESMRVAVDALRPIANPERVTTPLLVLGAQCDGAITPAEVVATALAYGTEAMMFPGMGHNMMLEAGWPDVAGRIHLSANVACDQPPSGGPSKRSLVAISATGLRFSFVS